MLWAAQMLAARGAMAWLGSVRVPRPTTANVERLMRDGLLRNHVYIGCVNAAPREPYAALAGRIAAGRPLEAIEEKESISLGDFARAQNVYVLQVKGNSMQDDHILDGDFVVVEQTQVANNGEIVVALVGGEEATLKRLYREAPGKIRLQPANSEMNPITLPASDVQVQGKVIGVLRKYR